ncbi:ABC transporter ATP-binding protein [Streptomyces sp. NPDC014685]|uniref:ABC transporter ATP-binding protein n=1 Tax=Streptomyces sp. NPDC014685 TaxID=3364881 RepID=UPI0036F889C0
MSASTADRSTSGGLRMLRYAFLRAWRLRRHWVCGVLVLQALVGGTTIATVLALRELLVVLTTAYAHEQLLQRALPSLLVIVGLSLAGKAALTSVKLCRAQVAPHVAQWAEGLLMERVARAPLEDLDRPKWRDAHRLAQERGLPSAPALVDRMFTVTGAVMIVCGTIAVLTTFHPLLLVLITVSALPDTLTAGRNGQMAYRSRRDSAARRRRSSQLNRILASRTGAAEIRVFRLESYLLDRLRDLSRQDLDDRLALNRRLVLNGLRGDLLAALLTGAVYGGLVVLVVRGQIPVAVAAVAFISVRMNQRWLKQATAALASIRENTAHLADFLEFCRAESPAGPEPEPTPALAPALRSTVLPGRGAGITLEKVTYQYPGAKRPALSEVNLSMSPGTLVAVIGENGSGKSTLAGLIAGVRRPDRGVVRWNGSDYRDLDTDTLRRHMALVPQELVRWPLSGAENIGLGDTERDIEAEALEVAARRSGAEEVLRPLPQGYDTLLSPQFENGVELSHGQWQRIALARALYRRAQLLVLDEPTSALDPASEQAVFEELRKATRGGATVVVITHRLEHARQADSVFVLSAGRLVEEGRHEELLALQGHYARMHGKAHDAIAYTLDTSQDLDRPAPGSAPSSVPTPQLQPSSPVPPTSPSQRT